MVEILYKIIYINMSSVLLDRLLDKLAEWTSLEKLNLKIQTNQITFKILIQKFRLDEQQFFWISSTLSEIKSKLNDFRNKNFNYLIYIIRMCFFYNKKYFYNFLFFSLTSLLSWAEFSIKIKTELIIWLSGVRNWLQ